MLENTDAADRNQPLQHRLRSGLGSVLLFAGVGLLSLLVADRTFGLPVKLPRSWYTDRGLWVAIGFISFGAGWYLLGDPKSKDRDAHVKTPGDQAHGPTELRIQSVVLYSRTGCCLCDEAWEVLEKYRDGLPPTVVVDIDSDPVLLERFSTCIPVVEIDGKVRFRGRVNEVLLRRLIEGTPVPEEA
jgi:Glutaredoxin-like domain (DUF836)